MIKKKKFGIPSNIQQGLSETIYMVEEFSDAYENNLLPLHRILLDPNNPRKLLLEKDELLLAKDENYFSCSQKKEEFIKLRQLADSINSEGIVHPIIVYREEGNYRIIAGERRYLASLLAGKSFIETRVLASKPSNIKLKLIQWTENNTREDLSLHERILNVKEIIKAYQEDSKSETINPVQLSQLTKLSRPQATYYLAVIQSSEELLQAIFNKQITNLDKAAFIAKLDKDLVEKAIHYAKSGYSLTEMKQLFLQEKREKAKLQINHSEKRGRQLMRINLGITQNHHVVKVLIDSIIKQSEYRSYANEFKNINWSDSKSLSKAIKRLIAILEQLHKIDYK